MTRWRIAAAAIVLIIVVGACIHWQSQRAQKRRDATYESALRSYSAKFPIGSSRKQVEDYLHLKQVEFWQEFGSGSLDAPTDLVPIGRDPAPWYCSSWRVYVALDFTALLKQGELQLNPRDSDELRRIRLRWMGEGCL